MQALALVTYSDEVGVEHFDILSSVLWTRRLRSCAVRGSEYCSRGIFGELLEFQRKGQHLNSLLEFLHYASQRKSFAVEESGCSSGNAYSLIIRVMIRRASRKSCSFMFVSLVLGILTSAT